jgi:hypothetical protein
MKKLSQKKAIIQITYDAFYLIIFIHNPKTDYNSYISSNSHAENEFNNYGNSLKNIIRKNVKLWKKLEFAHFLGRESYIQVSACLIHFFHNFL